MTISELLNQLRERGIVLACEGDELLVRSMERALDPPLLEALRANKPALRELVRSGAYAAAMAAPQPGPLLELTDAEVRGIVATVPGGADNVQDIYPLAPLQEGILFQHLMATGGDPYLSPILFRFDSREGLDRYLGALQAVVDRHDILRTSVAWEGVPEPVQVVWRRAPLKVEEVELDPEDGAVAEQLRARFDPRHHRIDLREAPMMRAHVARDEADGRWLLLLLRHHLVSDHTTLDVLWSEIDAHLAGRQAQLPRALPFRNFVAQARLGVSRDEHRAFFTEMLGDVDEPTAPFGVLDVRGDGAGMREARRVVEPALAARVRERARALGVSAASVFHVAWAQVLARASGRDDVVFGTLLFGRMDGGEGSDRVMGPFINTLPLRVRLGRVGAEASVRQTHALLAQLLRHEHASLALAQRCSGVEAPAPLFTSLLNYRHSGGDANASAAPAAPGGRTLLHAQERSNYPLAMSVDDLGEGFRLKAQVLVDSLDPARICALAHRALEGLVEALETAPSRAVGAIDVLPAEERARVLQAWNRTDAPYAGGSCIHELFQAHVERAPDETAVVFGEDRLTYAQLNARANRLAHHLRARGVGPDVRVGISVERGPEMVAAVLAVLKAGGAYVPLDPSYPADRLAYMLADSVPAVVLTQAAVAETLADVFAGLGADVPVLRLDASTRPWAAEADTDPARGALTPEHAAYVIYTSGSTGRPKGVLVPHRGLCNVAAAQQRVFGVGPGDRVLQFASLSFDAAAFELVMALASGAALCVAPRDELLPGPGLLALLRRHAITTVTLPPSALAALPVEELPALRTITTAGEALPAELAARWGVRHRLWNLYGPTEATIWSTVSECADPARTPDIGHPVANTRAYVLDAALEPLPVGVAGELYVGGAGVARGYLGRPALTAERFVPDPFGGEPGARLYRTGDLCRWTAEGALDFIGRVDHQVKVRGFRIEPGEIEARLREHPAVREAVVVAREDVPGEKRLVAYVVGDETADAEVLRAHLSERLPAHMVPAAFARLDAFPLTRNGKLDRRALPSSDGDAFARRGYEAPVGETEQALAGIWAEVLGVERVGRGDSFFALGGHSLLAVQVISRLRQVLGVEVALGELFARPVLADLARELETRARAELPPIEPAAREDRVPLSFAQHRLWFLERLGGMGGAYYMRKRLRLRGALDRAALVRALDGIVARHQALRTAFPQVNGAPEQRIAPVDTGFHLVEHDLGGRVDADAELDRLVAGEARAPFDLERGPLIRGRLVRLAADDHVLLITMHHIVSDGWSMGVLTDELSALYAAHREGRDAELPVLPVQYADYACWQRRWVDGDVLRRQADYWTETLADAPGLLELPADHPRPAQMDHAGARVMLELDPALTAELKALGQRHGATLYMTLLAGWAVTLGRLSGQADVVVGSPAAGRGRREIEGLIGLFMNTLALRVDLSGAPTVPEVLERVKKRTLGAQHHQDIPFERVVELVDPVRSLSHHPLFQVMFVWQNLPRGGGLSLPGLQADEVGAGSSQVHVKVDLSLTMWEAENRIVGGLAYATSLFERGTVERYVGYLRQVLREMVAENAAVHGLRLAPSPDADILLPGEPLRDTPVAPRIVADWWNQTGAALPAPELPTRQAPAGRPEANAGMLGASAWSALRRRCAEEGLTADGLLLGAFAEVLSTWSKTSEYAFTALVPDGGASVDRVALASIAVDHLRDRPFRERVARVAGAAADRARVIGRGAELLRLLRDPASGRGIAPIVFVSRLGADTDPELAVERGKVSGRLELEVWERDGALHFSWQASEARLPAGVLDDMAGAFGRLLNEIAGSGEAWDSAHLPLVPPEQLELRARVNATDAPLSDALLHTMFVARAAEDPSRVAVLSSRRELTYGELDGISSRIAWRLRGLGVQPGELVAVVMEKGWEQAAAVVAILKAGGAYLPIMPDLPTARLHELLELGEVRCALAQSWIDETLEWPAGLLRVTPEEPAVLAQPAHALDVVRGPDDLAYVIFTSGSTGRPKGVMISHRGAVNTIVDLNARWEVGPRDRVLVLSSLSFDLSVYDIFGALAAGGAAVFPDADRGRDPGHWVDVVERYDVTLWDSVPALVGLAVEYLEQEKRRFPASIRQIWMSGDWIPVTLPDRIRALGGQGASIISMGGATEASIWSILYPIGEVDPAWPSIPYGGPMVNQRFYVLSSALEHCPVWVPGELYIGGVGVALGYLHDPVKTAEKFITHPRTGERLYRTGDLGRYLPDGNIEFLGREDFQVKVRGYRIELGEIEVVLREHPAVLESVVAPHGTGLERRLVGYVVPAAVPAPPIQEIRDFLLGRLPEYMVPAALMWMDALPLTPNGKLDRRALPEPEADTLAARGGYAAPVGGTEEALAAVWAELLGVERVGRHDQFFELGGHSLLALKLIEQMRQRGLHTEIRALFVNPTVAGLAAALTGARVEVEVPASRIAAGCRAVRPEMLPLVELTQEEIDRIVAGVEGGAANVQDIYPLAPLQEGILFHHLMTTEGDPYLLQQLMEFDTRPRLDAWLHALQAVIARHDVLRTAVVWEGVREPVQVVWRRAPLRVEEVELETGAAAGDAARQLYGRFDPRHARLDVRHAPMMRACIGRDPAEGRWLLLLAVHHLTVDHVTLGVLQAEVQAHLRGEADRLPAPLPFRSLVAQARLGTAVAEHEAFFREMLGDVDEPTAPFGLLDVRGDGSGIDEARRWVDPRLAGRLRERARALGVSAAALCHVAWAQVLARVSGRDDVVFGTLLLGRMHGGEGADRVMGPFINTLPIRVRVGDVGAEASVRDTHALLARLLRHEHAPLSLAQRCSGVEAPAPLFSALLNYRHSAGAARSNGSAAAAGTASDGMRRIYAEERSNYPLTLNVDDLGEALGLTAKVRAPVQAARVAALMHTALEGLVEALETAPERAVGSIEVLPAEERARVLEEWNRTDAEYPRESCVHELFEAQAERTPDAPAVVCEGRELTYAELNARANRLAHHLIGLGVGPDVRVGLCMDRGMEMAVGLLAVLKAGGAYVPLDPDYPADRLRYMVEDSAPAALLAYGVADDSVGALVRGTAVPVIRLDRDAGAWADRPETNPGRADVHPDHLVYVIYTSGSTGRPKGVMNHHGCLVNRLAWGGRAWTLTADDVLLCKTSLSFDGHIRELFLPWSVGARVVMARPGGQRDPDYLLDVIRAEGVTTMNMNASMLLVLVEHPLLERCTSLRQLLVGGEALPGTGLTRLHERLPATALHITYGPSEAATSVTALHCGPAQALATVPIGRPTPNSRVYLLDPAGNPVPVGVMGELYIGGDSVCRGYLDRPALTADRFLPDPFGTEPGERLYRTGDLGRWLADGMMEFLGRNDFQVKVRGFRVELGEIEARLREHAGVHGAVVTAHEHAPGDQRLVAYYLGSGDVEAESLRAHLRERLPDYMVPSAFVRLEQWPLTPSGKLDRAALPAPDGDAYAAREYEAPVDETEEALAEIWAAVLRLERVGRRDDFFELGGHSLSAVRVVSRVRQELGVHVTLPELFARPVLKDFAQEILDAQLAQFDPEALAELLEMAREPVG
ncbi:MAG TPA: amino acid adenylation domain-containing protein [Longimicrobium sp.]